MKRLLKVLFVVTILAGIFVLAEAWRELYKPYRGYSGNQILLIEPGTSAPDVASTLVQRGILARRLPFLLRYIIGRTHHRLTAGEYLFDRPLRPIDVYQKLIRGDIYLHPVLIPEGSDRFDIAAILNRDLKINPENFLRITQDSALIRDLDPQAPTLEGYLFPDTYRFPRNVSAAAVVETMLLRFRHVYNSKFKQEFEQSGASLHDVITLASLVEKETPDRLERPIVAGVFARRLELHMQLACDPTVVYAARLDHRMLERPVPPITRSELEFNSPYNTYLHTGLPPGPIANPGEASIRAALAPAPGDALYFVSNNHGGHVFASTLAEHERNVARYRKQVAELRDLAQEQGNSQDRPSAEKAQTRSHAKNSLKKRGQNKKQKTTHPRTKKRARPRAGGRA
ncbi:MAG TPA: endolytic transglycosylase MltG [Terriglobia bacterium]|nr:endolytic transglycosylase MltG [Terriglobia bacterium]